MEKIGDNMNDWVKKLFAVIDQKDADGFASFLTQGARFRFANAPVVSNKENIRDAVVMFFSGVKSLRHHILNIWEQNKIVICEGEVTYTRLNGSELTVHFVDILRMKGDLIEDYRIFMDVSSL